MRRLQPRHKLLIGLFLVAYSFGPTLRSRTEQSVTLRVRLQAWHNVVHGDTLSLTSRFVLH